MVQGLIDPRDTLERQNEKLLKIAATLMRRVEQDTDSSGLAYAQFERAALLEEEVRNRTRDLERTLDLLNLSNAKLAEANRETEAARANLTNAIEAVQEGFALFNAQDVLVMCNSRFGMHMPDLRDHLQPGLRFDAYVTLVSQNPALALPPGTTTADWALRRMTRHQDRSVMFNVRLHGDLWMQISEHRTPDGGTVILQTDVTDIMRLQHQERERLLDDQARLIRATLEHLNQGVCIFDSQRRLLGWNRLLGDLLAIPVGRFRLGSRFETILIRLREDFDFAGNITANEVETWAKQDGHRPALTFDIQNSAGRVLTVFMQDMPDGGFVISFTDVTQERQSARAMSEAKETLEQRVLERTLELEDALAEAERANASKSRFVAAASHDLLQPLSAAKLFVSALDGELPTGAPRDTLQKAANALDSVETLLEALLDISRLDSGRAQVHLAPVDLNHLLQQLMEEMRPMAEAKGLRLRLRPTDHAVLSDITYLRRILQNLLSNALRYTQTGGVLVGARATRNGLRLEIWDTGSGIAEADQTRIFGEFQRLNATASAADGMGLGLAIVDRACALLGHPLSLRSRLGRGTVFAVDLPRAGNPQPSPPPRHPERSGELLSKLIVLLVEADTDLREALSLTMEQWGMDVLACADPAEAQSLIDEIGLPPDVMVADIPPTECPATARAMAALQDKHAPLPLCLISAGRGPQTQAVARQLNVPLLAKPLNPEHLRRFLVAQSPRAIP
ncbi:PAS-domain containing protein [Phaeobacter italicus]|uniref:hybrid sensor histidine kinase/response regulator n=1 Tax=Phaeobacter italicus TaxID=481446 RepID=UPI001ADB46AD|nr:PAS-domain containing protein [Phaeobacter italicus]MBO9441573.1 PAS-domain containing protein [Phaeobacter italicus]